MSLADVWFLLGGSNTGWQLDRSNVDGVSQCCSEDQSGGLWRIDQH